MKKILLLSAALAATCSAFAFNAPKTLPPVNDKFGVGPFAPAMHIAPTRASGAIDFSYAEEPYSALILNGTTPGTTRVFMFFQMSADDIKAYAGNKVTGFTVYSPTDGNMTKNTITEGRFFYSTTGKSEQYTQDFKFSTKPYEASTVSMAQSYTITGEEQTLWFGYSLVVPKANDMYYVPIDDVPTQYTGANMLGTSEDDTFPTQFQSAAPSYGALCMSIKIEGDNLPENMASIAEVNTPAYLPISGDGASFELLARNNAANNITSLEITTSVTGSPDVVQTFNFKAVPYNGTTEVKLAGIKGASAGFSQMDIKITKVNGEPFNGTVASYNVPCYDNGYPTMLVAEDATGTWCGWCPGGIEALDYLKKTYPNRAIAIGAHYNDVMQIEGYTKYFQTYVSGFPNVLYNRSIPQTPTQTYAQVCSYIDAIADFFNFPAYAKVEMTGLTNEDKTACNMTAKAEFAINTSVPHYLSFIIVEDGLGPYNQSNYFSSAGIAMNGWEKKNDKVSTMFDDVARVYQTFPGIENSLPAKIEANKVNEYSIELPLKNATGANLVKNDNYRVIALITNGETGRIVNACQVNMNKENNSVKNIANDSNIAIEGGRGQVIVNGADNYSVYTLAGVKVANKNLPAGLYIVVANGKTAKVIVK